MRNVLSSAAGLALALAIAGCSGGGTSLPASPAPAAPGVPGAAGAAASTATSVTATTPTTDIAGTAVTVAVTFPAAKPASSALRRAYISPSIQSLTIAVNGRAPTILNAPQPTGSPRTITTTIPVPAGTDTFLIAEYDRQNGAGNLLGRVEETRTVPAGRTTTLAFVVNGQLAKIGIQVPATPFLEGTLQSGLTLIGSVAPTFVAIPEDADGNTIITPGLIPKLTATSAKPAAIVATQGANDTFTLQAPAPTSPVAISVAGTDLNGKQVTSTFNVGALAAFYIADFSNQQLRVFDENGTPLALAATAFSHLSNPEGLAFAPGGAGNSGTIVVTETANPGYPYIVAYGAAGDTQALPAQSFTGLARPLFLTFATISGAGRYFVPDFFTNSLAVFDAKGTAVPLGAGSFANLINPVAAVYDPHAAALYATSDGSDTFYKYSPSGASQGSAKVGSHPMGAAFDPNNNSLYVAYAGTLGAAIDGQGPQLAGVTQFSEAPVAVSNPAGFLNASPSALFTGIAVDPYAKRVYVADAGNSKIDAFTENGLPVLLPSGAFATISPSTNPKSNPMAILFVP